MFEMLSDASDVSMIAILLGAAAVLMLLEIVTPSFGVLLVMAMGAIIGASYFGFKIGPFCGASVLLVGLLSIPVYLFLLMKILPNSPLGKLLFLRKAKDATADGTPEVSKLNKLVGKTGIAETELRPSGKICIDGQRVVAISEHELIEQGQKVIVIKAGGTDVVVRKAESSN
ncbi:MAG: NfeD family protein [Nitrospinaceae bacterium]|nr:NfeD family protein [Nitrospinaceae bacterium]